ncbi:hypothetical protein [Aquimarina aggregata]|uniref:hypothetical protein n=1 Tax=Aquimarina aggregata TaxID=1642818 RepID=UPI00248FBA91|nr:hypothetical protein [Aquimarina aggregata]
MLSNSEKDKIRLEEVYRQEVIKEIGIAKESNSSLWTFLNSGFVLFLLSSVVLGGLSFFYKEWKNDQVVYQRSQNTKKINEQIKSKLIEETLVRFNVIEKLADTIPEYKSKNVLIAYWGNSIREEKGLNLQYYHLRPLFAEYEKLTLLEILTELKRYSDGNIKEKISQIRNILIHRSEELNGGKFVYSKTRNGEILPPGRLLKSNNTGPYEWTYITKENRKIKLHREKIPLVRYFTVSADQRDLIKLIQELDVLLDKEIIH